MIPILFNETSNTFNTNGIGRMIDAISCVVTEERNGVFNLEMVYPINGAYYNQLTHSKILVVKPNKEQDKQAFRIYKITRPINRKVTIYANHISYDLNQIPVTPFTATGITNALGGILTNSKETNPFTFTTDSTNTETIYTLSKPKSARAILGGEDESILKAFGGSSGIEYKWDNYNVYAYLHRGANRGVQLRYGKNITDFKQEENIAETITGVLPYWVDSETDVAMYGDVQYSPYVNNYPMKRTIAVDFTEVFETTPTRTQLNTYAYNYIQDKGIPEVNIKVSFVELSKTDEYKEMAMLEDVRLCDTLAVYFEPLGISTTAKVIKTTYDVLKEKYESIEVGDAKSTMASTLTSALQTINSTSNKMVSVGIKVDKAEGKITTAVESVEEIGENLANNYSTTEQTSTSITNAVSEAKTYTDNSIGDNNDALEEKYLSKSEWEQESGKITARFTTIVGDDTTEGLIDKAKSDLQDSIDDVDEKVGTNTSYREELQTSIVMSADGITIGKNTSNIKGKFDNDSLKFIDSQNNVLASLDSNEGLIASMLSIGTNNDPSKRWNARPSTDGKHFTITRHS